MNFFCLLLPLLTAFSLTSTVFSGKKNARAQIERIRVHVELPPFLMTGEQRTLDRRPVNLFLWLQTSNKTEIAFKSDSLPWMDARQLWDSLVIVEKVRRKGAQPALVECLNNPVRAHFCIATGLSMSIPSLYTYKVEGSVAYVASDSVIERSDYSNNRINTRTSTSAHTQNERSDVLYLEPESTQEKCSEIT